MAGAITLSAPRNSRAALPDFPSDHNSDSPRKRIRYMPGGADRGGRHIDFEDTKQPVTVSRSRLDAGRVMPLMRSASARPRRVTSPDKPRYDNAAAAAAAATGQVDGYKPREERSWEEFHPDFDIEASVPIFGADEVDGIARNPGAQGPLSDKPTYRELAAGLDNGEDAHVHQEASPLTPRRRPGRPLRKGESMLSGLGSPPAPRIAPLPSHNPRERLNLPKPSYRRVETFAAYEADRTNQINYVDKTMAHVGFQESEMYFRTDNKLVRLMETPLKDNEGDLGIALEVDKQQPGDAPTHTVGRVEYDMDEQDERWLEAHNLHRKGDQVDAIKPAIFEITMTQIEREWHALERRIPKPNPKPPQTHRPRSSSAAAVNGETAAAGEEQDTKCAICDDGDCENTNAIVFCDGCDLAVHQECYGVPFIPEGQWLCRKCQMIGKSLPACVFCPNTEGAFKLTHEQRWAHLLCSIWIPEVTLGNPTFMEPIMDVAKVPKSRWKLTCYICNQKMGACIQCGHKLCFLAFHVTCARRAKLYLKMKSSHGQPFSLDASVLKALCDKHVPTEWGRDYDVPRATAIAKEHYRRKMKGRRWADSQASALAILPSQSVPSVEGPATLSNGDTSQSQAAPAAAARQKKPQHAQKGVWRLPSGAPIVPQVVFDVVEASLQRFTIRKRKEFVAEACKYWTLKREARRGAALLKRLQLQLESFSSSEITRRNFAAMGAAGGLRLRRRIDLADELLRQLETVRATCDLLKERERLKLQDVQMLKEVVDTVYFPMKPLLELAVRKASSLDPKGVFAAGFTNVYKRVQNRFYPSVDAFSQDLGQVFRSVAGLEQVKDIAEAQKHLANSLPRDEGLTPEQKEVKKLAKRIVKAIQQPVYDAFGKEAELAGKTFEDGVAHLTEALEDPQEKDSKAIDSVEVVANGTAAEHGINGHASLTSRAGSAIPFRSAPSSLEPNPANPISNHNVLRPLATAHNTLLNGTADPRPAQPQVVPPRPTEGGIPWYMEPFDPNGTEINEERWTGRDVLRGMSEELSEIDDDELEELGPSSSVEMEDGDAEEDVDLDADSKAHAKHLAKRRKRYRGFR